MRNRGGKRQKGRQISVRSKITQEQKSTSQKKEKTKGGKQREKERRRERADRAAVMDVRMAPNGQNQDEGL